MHTFDCGCRLEKSERTPKYYSEFAPRYRFVYALHFDSTLMANRGNIFHEISFHYPSSEEDYQSIRDMVVSHGGTMVNIPELAVMKLVPPSPCPSSGEYYDCSYVRDSVNAGEAQMREMYLMVPEIGEAMIVGQRFLEERYRMGLGFVRSAPHQSPRPQSPQPPIPRREYDALVVAPVAPFQNAPFRPLRPQHVRPTIMRERPIYRDEHAAIVRGRFFYTTEEDMKIIDFYIARGDMGYSANGQKLWKDAERAQLLQGRSWQSMEGRWKKYIRPNWEAVSHEYARWRETKGTAEH